MNISPSPEREERDRRAWWRLFHLCLAATMWRYQNLLCCSMSGCSSWNQFINNPAKQQAVETPECTHPCYLQGQEEKQVFTPAWTVDLVVLSASSKMSVATVTFVGGVRQLSLQVQMLPNSLVFSQASTRNLLGTASLRQMVDDKKRNIFCGQNFFIKILCKDLYCCTEC